MIAPGLPTGDTLREYVIANPGAKLGAIVAHFAPEGVDTTTAASYYWAVRDSLRKVDTLVVRKRRWYYKPADAEPESAPMQAERLRIAKQALEVKRRIGHQKALNAKFVKALKAAYDDASELMRMAAVDYNQDMRVLERELQAIARDLQLEKGEQ
jgi:hypothetical protein